MSKVKLCKFCKKHGTFRVSKGYTNAWPDDVYTCPDCKRQMIDVDYPSKDFDIIKNISYDPVFIESMINLRKKDPIEYQLKMSQFKTTQQQTKVVGNNSNKPQCPYCNSTDLKKISGFSKVGNVALFGIFAASKVGKNYHCNNCKSNF